MGVWGPQLGAADASQTPSPTSSVQPTWAPGSGPNSWGEGRCHPLFSAVPDQTTTDPGGTRRCSQSPKHQPRGPHAKGPSSPIGVPARASSRAVTSFYRRDTWSPSLYRVRERHSGQKPFAETVLSPRTPGRRRLTPPGRSQGQRLWGCALKSRPSLGRRIARGPSTQQNSTQGAEGRRQLCGEKMWSPRCGLQGGQARAEQRA